MGPLAVRIASPIVFAAAMLAAPVAGDPPPAVAEPREWDIGLFDACIKYTDNLYVAGEITYEESLVRADDCCESSGGVVDPGHGGCTAPAVAPSSPAAPPTENAPDVAGGSPPPAKPGPKPLTPGTLVTPTTPVPVG
jgi:hypothetical protein